MHVSVGEGIAIIVFAGILLLATVNVRRQWRGERSRAGTSERTLRVVVMVWALVVATGRPRFAMPPPLRRRSRR